MEKFKKKIFCMRGKKKNNMEIFMQIITNKYIYVPFFTWIFIQCFKVVWDLITTKKLDFKRIMGAGGMPSSHYCFTRKRCRV